MSQALYRKYRSKTLDEVFGQEHITRTLGNALRSGAISHAYLFTGPKGVGKTSVARILAHEINGLEYSDTQVHLDIIEIDAASNRRIDEIRDLRDKVYIAPTSAKYKVYIIDEVHMLTKESFNALLKTLEEPPNHVVFILATTESHKLPDTIVSRTQHFNFKPIDEAINTQHLLDIAAKESIDLEPEAAKLIAQHGAGSFRDSISLLDQLQTSDTISVDVVRQALGLAPDSLIRSILNVIDIGEVEGLISILDEAKDLGYSSPIIASQISSHVREQIKSGKEVMPQELNLLKQLLDVSSASDPSILLEIILLQALFEKSESNLVSRNRDLDPANKDTESNAKNKNPELSMPMPNKAENHTKVDDVEDSKWGQILTSLKSKHNTLYSIARMAKCEIDDSQVSLTFDFPFHLKRATEPKNKAILEDTVRKVLGKKVKLVCALNGAAWQERDTSSKDIKAISNIFGDVEVLES